MSGFRLTVEQIVAAIELLDETEQDELRMRLLSWLAGVPMTTFSPDDVVVPAERETQKRRPAMAPSLLDDDEMYLYDDLMAMMDE